MAAENEFGSKSSKGHIKMKNSISNISTFARFASLIGATLIVATYLLPMANMAAQIIA